MMDLETLRELNDRAARQARRSGKRPHLLTDPAQVEAMTSFPFPYLGDACEDWDSSWDRLDDLFVDSSGFGQEGEPALTEGQFRKVLADLTRKHGKVYAALREVGQFQVWVALWAGR